VFWLCFDSDCSDRGLGTRVDPGWLEVIHHIDNISVQQYMQAGLSRPLWYLVTSCDAMAWLCIMLQRAKIFCGRHCAYLINCDNCDHISSLCMSGCKVGLTLLQSSYDCRQGRVLFSSVISQLSYLDIFGHPCSKGPCVNFEALRRASLPTLAEGFVCFLEGSLVQVFWKEENNYMHVSSIPIYSDLLYSYLILP